MKIILVGYGNVGKEIKNVLDKNKIVTNLIVRSNGIFNLNNIKIDEIENLPNYFDSETYVFISIPSKTDGKEASPYYLNALRNGTKIITCEKAFLANHWNKIEKNIKQIKYSATVGGNSGILNAITSHEGNITEIKAIVNGTLNYIGDKLDNGLSEENIYDEVTLTGFAEPGSKNIKEVIENELNDVLYKVSILANHSRLYKKIIKPKNIILHKNKGNQRCCVILNSKSIKAGFLDIEDRTWFSKGVNNTLYINSKKIVEGPGAGAYVTAERMFKDFEELKASFF